MINADTLQQMPKKEEETGVTTLEPSDSMTGSNNDNSVDRQPRVKQEQEQENKNCHVQPQIQGDDGNAVALEDKQEHTISDEINNESMNVKDENNDLQQNVNNNVAVVLKQEQEEEEHRENESHESHDGALNGNTTNDRLETEDDGEGVLVEQDKEDHRNGYDDGGGDTSGMTVDGANDNEGIHGEIRQTSSRTDGDIKLPKEEEDSDDDDVDRHLFSDDDDNDEDGAVVNHQDSMQADIEEKFEEEEEEEKLEEEEKEVEEKEEKEEKLEQKEEKEEEETYKKVSQRLVKVTNYDDCTNYEDSGKGFPYHKYYKSELDELISKREWDKALERLRQNKTVMLKDAGACGFDSGTDDDENEEENFEIQEVGFVNELGALPLHQALYTEEEAPPDIFIKELIKRGMTFQSVEKRHRMSRLLPLQIACSPGGVDKWKRPARDGSSEDKIIRHLIKASPESLVATDNTMSEDCGGPPLQLLMVHNPGVRLFKFIMETLEENGYVQQALSRPDPDGDLPLHAAVKNCVSHDITVKIIESNKKAVETATNAGMYPLHYAALWGCHEDVLDELLDSHFTALQKRTKKDYGWDTPIHLAFHSKDNIERWMLSDSDDNGEGNNNNAVMRPGLMVDAMLREFHARLKETYEQGLGDKKSTKRKRTTQHSHAFTATQTLCKGKKYRNNSNKTILEQVKKCKEKILSQPNGRPTQDFQNIYLMIQEIVDGYDVFQR